MRLFPSVFFKKMCEWLCGGVKRLLQILRKFLPQFFPVLGNGLRPFFCMRLVIISKFRFAIKYSGKIKRLPDKIDCDNGKDNKNVLGNHKNSHKKTGRKTISILANNYTIFLFVCYWMFKWNLNKKNWHIGSIYTTSFYGFFFTARRW